MFLADRASARFTSRRNKQSREPARSAEGYRAARRKSCRRSERFAATPFFWSQRYDVPINYVGHAEKWDELGIEGDIKGKDSLVRFKRKGRTLAVASTFRDVDSLKAEVEMERDGGG
jgi:hypothetical protein